MKHPLLNQSSKAHYDADKRASIYDYEQKATVSDMLAVCEFEIFKYTSRLGKKTTITGNIEKIVDEWLKFSIDEESQQDLYIYHKEKMIEFNKEEIMKSDSGKIETWENYKKLLLSLLDKGHNNETVRDALKAEKIELEYVL
jgi:hypothetical protein